MGTIHPTPGRIIRYLLIVLFIVVSMPGGAAATEAPPVGLATYLQTNGPTNGINNGDWYTNNANGVVAGYHYHEITVSCGWPATLPVYIDLFSPEMVVDAIGDEVRPTESLANANNTTFELYNVGTVIGPNPNQPAPAAAGTITAIPYAPLATGDAWRRFATLAAPVTCGTYVLRAETSGDDENAWRIRVGTDDDSDPTNSPPTSYDNPDGLPGTDDEILIGVRTGSYQNDVTAAGIGQCLTLYEFAAPGQPSISFHSFDMDNTGRVRYYAPSDTYDPLGQTGGTAGTLSGSSIWNGIGGSTTNHGTGDTIANPESGWWRIVTCISNNNQYIQEGQTASSAYYEQPPIPAMTVAKDDGVTITSPGDQLTYTITYTNTSSGPTAGAASNVVLKDTIPTNTSYVGCSIPVADGTCSQAGGVVTFTLSHSVLPGAKGSVQVTVQVDAAATGTVSNTVTLDYKDSLGNPYPQKSATDIDTVQVTPVLPVLAVTKDDGVTAAAPGDNLTYTISYENVTSGTPTVPATNIVLRDTIPSNTTYVASSCLIVLPATGVCSQAGGVVTFTINGSLAVGDSGQVQVTVTVNPGALGTVENTVTLDYEDNAGNPRPQESDSDTDQLPTRPVMTVSKTDGLTLTNPGDSQTYTISYANVASGVGAGPATNVVLRDTIPTNATYGGCTIPPADGTCSQAGGVVTFTLAHNVLPGTGGSVQVTVQVNASATGTVVNNVTLDYQDDSGNAQPQKTASDTDQLPPPDLRLLKSASTTQVTAGQLITYTLKYFNDSVMLATGVQIAETVPVGTHFVAAGGTPGWSCADGSPAGTSCILQIGTVAGNATGSVTFIVRVDTPLPTGITQIDNTAHISDDGTHGADPTPSNNSGVTSAPPLAITLIAFTARAVSGGVLISWQTGSEVASSGFHIYRSADGSRHSATRITPALVVTRGQGGAGASYSWLDTDAPADAPATYWLQEIELDGTINEEGPFSLTSSTLDATTTVFLPLVIR